MSPLHIVVNRRVFSQCLLAQAAWLAVPMKGLAAPSAAAPYDQELALARQKFRGHAGSMAFSIADHVADGKMVAFSISVDSPMTETDHVTIIRLLSSGNAQTLVSEFALSPACGRAAVSGRMRLAKTQNVAAIVHFSDGRAAVAERHVDVTVGGCS